MALFDEIKNPPVWTTGSQPLSENLSDHSSGLFKFGLGVGALGLFGKHQFASGKRGFDYLVHGVRALEEYSPGRVLRTFQISHMLSSLESTSRINRYFSPEIITQLRNSNPSWLEHLSRLTGQNITSPEIMKHGFRFEGNQLRVGRSGGRVLLKHAGVISTVTGAAPRFQEAYVRSLGRGPVVTGDAFAKAVPFFGASGTVQGQTFMFTGGQTRLQAARRFISGYGTSLVERINQLARAPFELEPLASMLKKVPILNRVRFGVTPSSGLKTLAKITGKLGVLGGATFLAYRELDHLAKQSSILDKTVFGEGLTAGFATMWTRGQVAISKAAEATGLHTYREKQEEIAPGSTSLTKLAAFPIIGAMSVMTGGYLNRLYRQGKYRGLGMSLGDASILSSAHDELFRKAIYQTELTPELTGVMSRADKKTLSLIHKQSAKQLSGWEGKLAKSIAKSQARRGLVPSMARALGKMTPSKIRLLGGVGIGAALIAPFIPGALMPETRPDELEDIYSGKQRVAIRKGRWWEFGRTPYEGTRIDRFRAHWYPRMLAESKEKSIWGEDSDLSPLERWWKENFTYELEQKHYRDRPYPITGTAFEDVPFLGPILSATIGKLIKPPKLMHAEEWMGTGSDGESTTRRMPLRFGEKVLEGELEPGSPVSPYEAKGVLGEQTYRLTEMIGLPGFTMTSIKEKLTGRSDLFDQEMQLESARRMYGAERGLWDLELGGGLGTTELLRRLYPHRRRQIPLYNPIRNTMPDWLPGPGDKSPDFLHGDPFTKVPEGEMRLPGVGYAALNPQLRGVEPKDYPVIHQLAILGDIAPYSDKYREALIKVRAAMGRKELSEEDIAIYKRTLEEVKQKKVRKHFTPYQYRDRAMTEAEVALASEKEEEEPGLFSRMLGSYWETLGHGAETPTDILTPVSPAAKLLHMRTAVEDYERTQVFGTDNAFWGHPIRDFIKPFMQRVGHALGADSIPESVADRRDLEEYFDILKYVKYTRLKSQAMSQGDRETVQEYEDKRRETLFGINPYTYNFTHIFRSLPRRDRDYFNAFVEADMEERREILQMVPENERALFLARWQLKDANDYKRAIKKGLLTEQQAARAEQEIQELYNAKTTEGMPKTQELWAEYLQNRMRGESYPDWYRRTYLLEEALDGRSLPGPDWVGWHPAVDLEDIKLKIVQNEGENAYDYDLWPDRARAVARRPFIGPAAEALFEEQSPEETRQRIQQVLNAHNIRGAFVSVQPDHQNSVHLEFDADRSHDIRSLVRGRGLG